MSRFFCPGDDLDSSEVHVVPSASPIGLHPYIPGLLAGASASVAEIPSFLPAPFHILDQQIEILA
jgi:hypothetical protein